MDKRFDKLNWKAQMEVKHQLKQVNIHEIYGNIRAAKSF